MTQAFAATVRSCKTILSDTVEGFLEITHNGFALLGLATIFCALTLLMRPDLRASGETRLMDWLQSRQTSQDPSSVPEITRVEMMAFDNESDAATAIERTTAASPQDLPKQQAAIAYWLSKKYRVAAEPLSVLVAEAYDIGKRTQLDPTLILAIVAIESGFNPFAQSHVGAQGLMQVMTRVHSDKYERTGGSTLTAFDPVTNMRVGVKVLQECIARAGSLEGGLRYYVGAANLPDDGGYTAKVLAEQERLRQVAMGRSTAYNAPIARVQPPPAAATPPKADPEGQKVALIASSS